VVAPIFQKVQGGAPGAPFELWSCRVATAKQPSPGKPGFRVLPAPPVGGNVGKFLNSEAIRRLILAYDSAWSYDDLVDLYDSFRLQIQRANPGWTADRGGCSDGSTVFVGSLGAVLAIMPDRSLLLGQLAGAPAAGLLSYQGMTVTPTGTVQFPPPNPSAPGTRRLR
jgi:hypothetical protein